MVGSFGGSLAVADIGLGGQVGVLGLLTGKSSVSVN